MGVVVESQVWEPNSAVFILLLISCVCSILCLPNKAVANVLDHAPTASFLRFHRKFLLLYALSSVMEGLWAVFGDYELAYYGLSKEQMLSVFTVGFAGSLFVGSFLGLLSDLIGHKKLCVVFYTLHVSVSMLKIFIATPTIWFASICLSLASSIFSFSFETWMVIEHDKIGQRQDSLNDMFWLMTFFESAAFIVSQMVANYLIGGDSEQSNKSVWGVAVILAVIAIIYVNQGWKEAPQTTTFKDYRVLLHRHAISDKRIWLLSSAQACLHFSVAAFWILWAPVIVADGREVLLGLIYPCLLGSKMLGSTGFPWFLYGPIVLRLEEYLAYVFVIMGVTFTIVAYDYQEIGLLVTIFCLFHICLGVVLPSLARLRTMYVPNEIRGGMMSLSQMPANAALLFFLILRGYSGYMENSTLALFAALGLFSAAYCMYLLRNWGKQLHQSRHNL